MMSLIPRSHGKSWDWNIRVISVSVRWEVGTGKPLEEAHWPAGFVYLVKGQVWLGPGA